MTGDAPMAFNRTERVLLTMAAAVGGLSIIGIAVVAIARAVGVTDFSTGAWPAIALLPSIGLPIAFVLMAAFLIAAAVRRRRAQEG